MSSLNIKLIVLIIVVLGVTFAIYRSQDLFREFKVDAREGVHRTKKIEASILTEKDISHLPQPVQKYLRYVGVLGKEKVKNLRVEIEGSMKTDRDKDWADVSVQQYSFFDRLTRLFYISMSMKGLPIYGLHSYKDAKAVMLIKAAGLIPVVEGKGKEMNQAETVTVFNDMCIMAPATLIDDRIRWEPIDSLTTRAFFTNEGITISAILYFNEEGQLVNFTSNDRYYSPTGKTFENVMWSTPVSNYEKINGFNLATFGEALWSFPDGDFSYARFNIKEVEYNVEVFR